MSLSDFEDPEDIIMEGWMRNISPSEVSKYLKSIDFPEYTTSLVESMMLEIEKEVESDLNKLSDINVNSEGLNI